jgi:DNA-binding beta-propeller fold protein YncE
MKKLVRIICIVFAVLMVAVLPLSAAKSYQTYTYSIDGTALYSPDAYSPLQTVNYKDMGLTDAIVDPSDLEVDEDNNVYIVDTGTNRVICLDRYYKARDDVSSDGLKKGYISEFTNEYGVKDTLTSPRGVFITKDKYVAGKLVEGLIYVCDTARNRIVVFEKDGTYVRIINQPESELFDEGAMYKPVAVAVDAYDRLFVVSESTTEGIIVMTSEGEFTKFIGAQMTSVSAWEIIMRRFRTDEQQEMTETVSSDPYNNLAITDEGFIYATLSITDKSSQQSAISGHSKAGTYAPVKMLNASGDEIMRRNGFWPPSGEVQITSFSADKNAIVGPSEIVDVAVGPSGTWSIIDNKRGKIFTYDYDGNLLFAFGNNEGKQLGQIPKITAVVYQQDPEGNYNMLVLDKGDSKSFTVYRQTDYGKILLQALDHQNERQYDMAINDWTEILKRNSNFDAAYVGIGKALYRSNQYEESLEYYKAAYDVTNYSLSYKEIRKNWIGDWIIMIPVGIGLICFVWLKLMKYAGKVNKAASLKVGRKSFKEELLYVFHIMFHPFDGFWDLKHEKRGSIRASIVFIVITIVAYFYKAIGQGYLIKQKQGTASITTWIISVLVTVFLWTISNWCLTTLFDGEGSFKDIFIAVSYSLLPVPLTIIPTTIMSNFIIESEKGMLSFVETLGIIYMVLLVVIGMMVTHDYSISKNIVTTAGTIIAMVFIMFVTALFSTLLMKLVGFVSNIAIELKYRM